MRSQRSTSAPAGKVKSKYGTVRAAATKPATAGEPVRASTSRGKAICVTWVPRTEMACPHHRST